MGHHEDDGPPEPLSVPDILESMANTFRERNAMYKDGYKDIGRLLKLLLGEIEVCTEADYNRFTCLVMIVGKLQRYCKQFEKGGHKDSLQDLAVYSAMLMEIDNGK